MYAGFVFLGSFLCLVFFDCFVCLSSKLGGSERMHLRL